MDAWRNWLAHLTDIQKVTCSSQVASTIFGGVQLNKLILGLLSTILAVVSYIVFWWLSIVAIVLGVAGLALRPVPTDSLGSVTAGKVLSIAGIVLAAVGLLIFLIALI